MSDLQVYFFYALPQYTVGHVDRLGKVSIGREQTLMNYRYVIYKLLLFIRINEFIR
jgi:hypothetical protein